MGCIEIAHTLALLLRSDPMGEIASAVQAELGASKGSGFWNLLLTIVFHGVAPAALGYYLLTPGHILHALAYPAGSAEKGKPTSSA